MRDLPGNLTQIWHMSLPKNTTLNSGEQPMIRWSEAGEEHSAAWYSEAATPPPKRVVVADDTITADAAYRLACEGTAILWRGDFQNARQLLQAMARRMDGKHGKQAKSRKPSNKVEAKTAAAASPTDLFNRHRLTQSQRARTLGMLLLPFEADYTIPLRRAPDIRQACLEAWGLPHWARRRTTAFTRTTASSRRCAANIWNWSPMHRYQLTLWPLISAPAQGCWRPYWHGAA